MICTCLGPQKPFPGCNSIQSASAVLELAFSDMTFPENFHRHYQDFVHLRNKYACEYLKKLLVVS